MDEGQYGELLKEIRPRIIETPDEHERLLSIAETLMEKGDALSEHEREALALIVLLIEAFETHIIDEDVEEQEDGEDRSAVVLPHVALQRLLASRNLEPRDIAPVFGNPRMTREVLEGSRPITKGQAKELGKYFSVPARLFEQ